MQAQPREPDAQRDRWQLADVFPTVEAFQSAMREVDEALPSVRALRGSLASGSDVLLSCCSTFARLDAMLGRLRSFAGNHASLDLRDERWGAADAEVGLLAARYAEARSWFEPELSALGLEAVLQMVAAEPRLAPYRFPLCSVMRRSAHVLSPAEERILALVAPSLVAPATAYEVLANAEIPWPTLELPDGEAVVLRQAAYTRLRAHADPTVRRQVFDGFFGALAAYAQTMGATLGAQVQARWAAAQARGFASSVEAALSADNIPTAVYDTLLDQTRRRLPTLHRYLRLRGRLLGGSALAYSDLYAPLSRCPRAFPLADCQELVLASAAPLGPSVVEVLAEGFRGGWLDVYPRPGKRAGAYMSDSAYGVHPFVLLNHHDDYLSCTTLAHEMGHALHSWFAMRAQPYPTASYAIFVAEVASTCQEALLVDHLLAAARDDEERLFYLGAALETYRTTWFRQAMLAAYERDIHAVAERGEALTGAVLTERYAALVRSFHGHDAGLVTVDTPWTHEWQFIPHLYYGYYVYQYATSLAASAWLVQGLRSGDPVARDRYLSLLAAGGSDDPTALLARAGVDLASAAPYDALDAQMNDWMDEVDRILARRTA
jgi:oligoendopeptidase F